MAKSNKLKSNKTKSRFKMESMTPAHPQVPQSLKTSELSKSKK